MAGSGWDVVTLILAGTSVGVFWGVVLLNVIRSRLAERGQLLSQVFGAREWKFIAGGAVGTVLSAVALGAYTLQVQGSAGIPSLVETFWGAGVGTLVGYVFGRIHRP